MKTQHILDCPSDTDFTVLAINSHIKGYKLCWNINNTLKVNFEKQEDHNIQDELWFARYTYICDEGVEYNLLSNRSKQGYLIPSQKSVNYFLVIKKNYWTEDKKEFINKLGVTKDILLVFELDTTLIKDINRFILNDKKN
tara:strand:+ start:2431 stop:2850 length:420 start_codon:yes stop_codon:yes gene_type:complete